MPASGSPRQGVSAISVIPGTSDSETTKQSNSPSANGVTESVDLIAIRKKIEQGLQRADDPPVPVPWRGKQDRVIDFGIDSKDANTPDLWVPRHPELIRLTGRHPFNCEAPLSRLMENGFITPVSLHYVRNHGAVPKADWDTWRIEIGGLVERPMVLSMKDILAMPVRTIPLTMVCAGNRRKEQNMVQQTKGFNWGPAGVSTSVWTGVRLCDVLNHVGILPYSKGARYVEFDSADVLPGGGGSTYGTSIVRGVAMDPGCDVLLAYMQNGELLAPDHGFPIRTILPGHIGGRTVKWLTKVMVTDKESSNYYHYHDNRVFPSHVDADRAAAEGWWYKSDFVINDLNINSAISSPAHLESIPLTLKKYTFRGYGYSGGGRKIIRAELSLDGGSTWLFSELENPETPTKYGKHWCWSFWKIEIPVDDLLRADEIVLRCWDSAMNSQPDKLTWNLMGMMNNCWYRVKFHKTPIAILCEHPTLAGNQEGGWMARVKAEREAAAAAGVDTFTVPQAASAVVPEAPPVVVPVAPPAVSETIQVAAPVPAPLGAQVAVKKYFTMEEVKKHDSEDDVWIVVHGKVYDCTKFLEDHPGGAESIMLNAGVDATEEFDAIHSETARAMLDEYYIGDVKEGKRGEVAALPGAASEMIPVSSASLPRQQLPVALNPKEKIPMRLSKRVALSHDVRLFRFDLPNPEQLLGLPIGKHMFLSAKIGDKNVMRAYTPTSSDDDVGHFDLVVKIYYKGVHPNFPDGGLMSQHLDSLKIGDTIDVKGPVGHIHYTGNGHFTVSNKPHFAKKIAMLAGGTGITPMYQVAKEILKNYPQDETEMWLIFANRSADDVLLKEDLDAWAEKYPNFHVWYTIEVKPENAPWPYSLGRISEEMFREHLPPAGPDTVAFMCGPPPMIKFGCVPNLEKMGYTQDKLFSF